MFEKIEEFFENKILTLISGIFLLLELVPHIAEAFGAEFDPLGFLPVKLIWITIILSGVPLVINAVKKLIFKRGISKISSALLISIAMVAAIAIGDLFAAAEVAFIMAIGELLEDKTTEKAKTGLKKLISLTPRMARRIKDGNEESIEASALKEGDIIRILAGETVAADGKVIAGASSIDEAVITGESMPVDKEIGSSVFAGTVNRFGTIDVVVEKEAEDSTLQRLINMVRDAENKQAPMQRTADKWASVLVPVALVLAIIAGLVRQDIVAAVTVLVVFCPCALVLATPTAIMAAIGQATKHGVIIKSGEALEKMGKARVIALDKTGTITHGKPEVCDIYTAEGIGREEFLREIASAERKSEHPLGKAVVEHARENGISLSESDDFAMESGKGITASFGGDTVICGSESFVSGKGITLEENAQKYLADRRAEGKVCLIGAKNDAFTGIITLSDKLRDGAADMIGKLKAGGVKTVLLTGDNKKTAEYFASAVKVDEVCAELLPEDKVSGIEKLRESGLVCMVGDGVNDAPALKIADIGVAMASVGSDIAIDAADIALVSDDISKIPYLQRLSAATLKTIRFSISLSLLINLVGIVLSFFGLLTPTTGALVHNAGSVFVVMIAAMLYEKKIN